MPRTHNIRSMQIIQILITPNIHLHQLNKSHRLFTPVTPTNSQRTKIMRYMVDTVLENMENIKNRMYF